jgi:hypothetical protein
MWHVVNENFKCHLVTLKDHFVGSLNPNKCLCMCGIRLEVFEICLDVEPWGCKFVVCTWHDVNLLHEIATIARY